MYTGLDISLVKLYFQWRTLIEILKKTLLWKKGGSRQKTQHSLSEQEVLSQIYIFQTIDVCERKQMINFHSQRTFQVIASIIPISPVVCCTPFSFFLPPPTYEWYFSSFQKFYKAALFAHPICRCSKDLGKGQMDYHLRKQLHRIVHISSRSWARHKFSWKRSYCSPSIRQLNRYVFLLFQN